MVPLPEVKDYTISVEKKQRETNALSQRQKEYLIFWRKIIDGFNEKQPDIINRSPSKSYYLSIPVGIQKVHFEWLIRTRDPPIGFLVALHFEKLKSEQNKRFLDYFLKHKEELQKNFKDEIHFQKVWGKNGSQIYILNDSIELDEDNVNWGVEIMLKFYATFKPYLDKYSENNE